MLSGRRPVSDDMVWYLGFKRVVSYERLPYDE
jgi:hypothetical protein